MARIVLIVSPPDFTRPEIDLQDTQVAITDKLHKLTIHRSGPSTTGTFLVVGTEKNPQQMFAQTNLLSLHLKEKIAASIAHISRMWIEPKDAPRIIREHQHLDALYLLVEPDRLMQPLLAIVGRRKTRMLHWLNINPLLTVEYDTDKRRLTVHPA